MCKYNLKLIKLAFFFFSDQDILFSFVSLGGSIKGDQQVHLQTGERL